MYIKYKESINFATLGSGTDITYKTGLKDEN